MSTPDAPQRATRVFAIVPSRRYTGYAVLDAGGIFPGGFGSWGLRRRKTAANQAAGIRDRIAEMILCCAPTVVVVGAPIRHGTEAALLRESAESMAKARGIPSALREVSASYELLLGRREAAEDGLARLLVGAFFPDLAGLLSEGGDARRYRHNAFSALALALRELAIRAPLAAAAASRDEAFSIEPWSRFLSEQARRLYPHNRYE